MSFLLHDPIWRPLDTAGAIMPGCYFVFYQSETETPAAVYADADLTTPLGQVEGELISNAAGRFRAIYGASATVYRRRLYNASNVLLEDVDPIHPSASHPAGTVVMFRGDATARDAAYPPSLWAVCDGDDGTIDFRDRMPIGVSNTKAVGDTGGATGAVESTSDGAHDHGAVTGSTTLTTNQIPAHRHAVFANVTASGALSTTNQAAEASNSGGDTEYSINGSSTDATEGRTSEVGGGTGHTHTVASGGAHTHDVDVPLPPWGAVWFLERLP
jgi:hypothetical protein